jgi:HK97 family phage major capsid protein
MTKPVKLAELTERIVTVETEMRGLYDAAATAGEDLTGEKLEKWEALRTELDELKGKEVRARQRDELARTAEGKPLTEERGAGDVWALKREQRMTDFIAARSKQKVEPLSAGRLIGAIMKGDFRDAELEHRTMGSGVNTLGGFFVPDLVSATVIDLARNASVMLAGGALTIPMVSNSLNVVRVLTDPTANYRGEGQVIVESDATFDSILMSPRSLAALVRVNNELLDDIPQFGAQLDQQLAAALAIALDKSAIYGDVTKPSGLRFASGVSEVSMGTNGAALANFDNFLDLIKTVELANGAPDTLIWAPRAKNSMAKLVTGISGDLTKLMPAPDFAALRKLVTNQITQTETQGSSGVSASAYIGGFSNCAFAMRQQVQVEISRQSSDVFTKNQSHIRAILRADFALLRPALIGRLVGIL